jgi:regulator of RNase E activity RraA
MQTGCLGGMLMTALATKGCAGLVVDGCVRDLPEAMELGPNATNLPQFLSCKIAFKSDTFLPSQAEE